jgi:protoheme IX farnesyltransferase
VLVRQQMTPRHAATFGALVGVAGTAILYTTINPLTALLGASNIVLYTAAYTYLKRHSIVNTWVGSVVGAIPPVMGWTAVTGSIDGGALMMGALLYAWQFPHFNSLSWNIRDDYQRAGYKMMANSDPALNARVALRYSLALFPICWGLTALEVTSPCFMLTSAAPNAWMAWYAYQFNRDSRNDQKARKLFFSSLFHLPAIIVLMYVCVCVCVLYKVI